jgi:hypothetical protein
VNIYDANACSLFDGYLLGSLYQDYNIFQSTAISFSYQYDERGKTSKTKICGGNQWDEPIVKSLIHKMVDIASNLTVTGNQKIESCSNTIESTNTTWIVQNCNGKVTLCIGNDCLNSPYSTSLLCEINENQILSSHDAFIFSPC